MRKVALVRFGARWGLALVGATLGCQGGIFDTGRGRQVDGNGVTGAAGAAGTARGGAGQSGASRPDGGGAPDGATDPATPALGAWTAVKRTFPATLPDGTPGRPGTAQLLTDGRVLASGPETSNAWYTLTPDAFGSYENGTWAPAARAAIGRIFAPGFILPDGRYWFGGGEYVSGGTTRAENELYDPATDTWTVLPDMPEEIADSLAAVLGDGRVLVFGHAPSSSNTYLLSLLPLPGWSLAASWSRKIGDQESSSTLLQDGSVLVGSRLFQLFQPASGTWVDTAVPPGGPGVFVPDGSDEMGPLLVLHDGRALVLGATNKNGLFTTGGPGGAGSWTKVADTPAPYNHGDAPSIVEPDGKVLTVVTDDEEGVGYAPAVFYEYDPAADTWSLMATPFAFNNAERVILLALPNGQIWASGPGSPRAWLYTPVGASLAIARPSLDGVSAELGDLALTGAKLNGTTTGADLGDDGKMATNFPIVSFTDAAGHVYYGRSYGFDDMAPGRCRSARVVPPRAIPDGTYVVHVAASGVLDEGSLPVTFAGPRVASIAAPDGAGPGQSAAGVVRLTAPAPAGGALVELATSDARVASVPAAVVVPAGATSANFGIDVAATIGSATLRAATASNRAFAASTVFGWSVTSVGGAPGTPNGTTASWSVALDNPAPASDLAVDLTSTNPALVAVPARVTVPAGRSSAAFTVTLGDPLAGAGRVYATLPGSAQSGPFGWYVAGLTGPASAGAGVATTWTVSLNAAAPAGGLVVGLSSTASTVATVPSAVTIPAGQTSTTFSVSARGEPLSGTTWLRATFNASSMIASFQYLVTAAIAPTTIAAGATATGTLTVSPAAPAGGWPIALASSDPTVASVPGVAMIPPGATSAQFTVKGAGGGSANITMTLGTWSRMQGITVRAR
jgi:hypothetical protein